MVTAGRLPDNRPMRHVACLGPLGKVGWNRGPMIGNAILATVQGRGSVWLGPPAMIKNATLFLLLAGCIGVPYAMSNSGLSDNFQNLLGGPSAGAAGTPSDRLAQQATQTAASVSQTAERIAEKSVALLAGAEAATAAMPSAQPVTLEEAIRFDVTKNWVLGHWPRVSTQLSKLDLEGYRVPLITGTHEGALAGSLTYYFNKDQQLQRIIFMGNTGDTRPLVNLVTSKYGFTRNLTDDPGLYLYQVKQRRNKAESELRMRAAGVVESASPYERFTVALWIERPKNLQ